MIASRICVDPTHPIPTPLLLLQTPAHTQIVLQFLNPSLTAILAWLLLREQAGWATAAGCAASLVGVALVAQPPFLFPGGDGGAGGSAGWDDARLAGTLFGVAGAALAAGAYVAIRMLKGWVGGLDGGVRRWLDGQMGELGLVCARLPLATGRSRPLPPPPPPPTRHLPSREHPLTVALWFHTSAGVMGAVPTALGLSRRVMPSPRAAAALAGIACCSFTAQLLLNRGFSITLAAKAAAINYTQASKQAGWAGWLGGRAGGRAHGVGARRVASSCMPALSAGWLAGCVGAAASITPTHAPRARCAAGGVGSHPGGAGVP